MFNPTRDQVRQFFFDTWRKYGQNEALTALEGMALQVIQAHPEYHAILGVPGQFMEQEYFPEMGETNPFLHMSLHLSVLEQLAIDQPPGIAATYKKMVEKDGEHGAQHLVLDCLAETVWRAQHDQAAPDGVAYLACLQRHVRE